MSLKEKIHNGGSISAKLMIIGFLILVFIPVSLLVRGLIEERSDRQEDTVYEVSSKWGLEQTITGPVLTVPYLSTRNYTEYAYFLPDTLDITGDVKTETRSRGIYDVPLYEGKLTFKGGFSQPNFSNLGSTTKEIYWDQAFIAMEIPDMRGLTEQISLSWLGNETDMGSGLKTNLFSSGVSAPVFLDRENPRDYDFSFSLNLRGSESLYFVPIGKQTTVKLTSDWLNPSFDGGFLPIEHNITENGFDASWSVLDLNTGFSRKGTSENYFSLNSGKGALSSSFGVEFYLPVDVYQKTTRSAKYAIAVISLVFLVLFLVEVIAKKRIHPLQYLLIGLALCIFYTLLLSLSEYIRFVSAYIIASIAIVGMIGLFSKSVMKSWSLGLTSGGIVALLYAFIYVLLQMEDFTLLIGSFGIFVILAIVMYVTRSIDWYKKEVQA